jgi:hypothetical protein
VSLSVEAEEAPDGVFIPVAVRRDMNRTRLTGAVYALFGVALLVDSTVGLAASVNALDALVAGVSLWILAAGVAAVVETDATVFGVDLAVAERPTWMLVLLTLGSVLVLGGVALRA